MTAALPGDLLEREAYPFEVSEVELVETHISWVFFADRTVYKVKKPLRLDFLDYSTVELRKRYCEEEVRLNRRLAPEVYRGIVPLTRDRAGRLRVDGDGTVVDWAVEMRRLPEHRMLDRMLERGEIDNLAIERVARMLVAFHAGSEDEGVSAHGSPEAVRALVAENFAQLEPLAGAEAPLSAPILEFLRRRSRAFLDGHRDLLRRRVAEGRIRDGHGDLHAGNLCFTDDGIVAYDCLEFSERFRCGDQALDLAFLAMDLDFRGFHAFAAFLAKRYAELAEDPELPALMPFYKAYRATVRAKVHALAADDAGAPQRHAARAYLDLAASYELPPCLVLTCGLPASGKSWAARSLSRRWGSAWLRSDVRRKALAGVPTDSHAPSALHPELYSDEMTARTYASLLDKTAEALGEGRGVVVDATFSRREQRRPFLDLAHRLSVPVLVTRLQASDEEIRRRLARRRDDPADPSDAGMEVHLRARRTFEEPDEVPADRLLSIDTTGLDAEDLIVRITERRVADASRGS